ncbi:MAG: signal recognition particle protein, partial [Ureaplasma sp.]|nr:signal recognition particle protein [Ureaplasma sp.]
QYKNKNDKKPLLVACDIYRPAAIDQLEKLASEINVDFYKENNNKPDKIARNAIEKYKDDDLVIVDTAGRLQTNDELMNELIEIKKTISPDEILLVVDAMSGQDVMNVAVEFNNKLKLTGIVITKLDSDARAGAILSLVSMLNVPIKLIGNGEKIGSLDTFYPERIADRILGFGDVMSLAEKASEIMDEHKIKHAMQRMLSGKMDLEDLMRQMEQLNKFGSLGGIMKMLPTNLTGAISDDKLDGIESSIKKWKVLLSSMTLKERRDPRVFKKQPNRKVRVIKGSGMKMDELNKLLKQWETGKNKMAEMGKQLMLGKNPFTSGGFK